MKLKDVKIDWNTWHEKLHNAIEAFNFDGALKVIEKLGIYGIDVDGENREKYDITPSILYSEVEDRIEKIIRAYTAAEQNIEVEKDDSIYFTEEGTIETYMSLHSKELPIDPQFRISLKSFGGEKYIEIEFIIASQLW